MKNIVLHQGLHLEMRHHYGVSFLMHKNQRNFHICYDREKKMFAKKTE